MMDHLGKHIQKRYIRHKNHIRIPVYDLIAIGAGFYIGYAEGKGLDVRAEAECLAKYGPTALAAVISPISIWLTNRFLRWTNDRMLSGMYYGNLEVKVRDGYKKFGSFSEEEKRKMMLDALRERENIESIISRQKYLRSTIIATTKTAIETIIGYAAGRIYSKIN